MRHAIMAAILALLPMLAANAHQGWSSYDMAQALTVTAPLTALRWDQPHAAAKIRYDSDEWDVVLAPVSRLEARGLRREMVANGQEVTLIGYPRTDGTREMRIARLIVGGRTVELR